MAASVHQRLINNAKASNRPFADILQYFAIERFLYRLCQTSTKDAFILKGALLFQVWELENTRATRDIDLLGKSISTPANILERVKTACRDTSIDDGLEFDADSVIADIIKEDAEYPGVRVTFNGQLKTARIYMQIDIGFGDTVYPDAALRSYPTLLNFPAPQLGVYPMETVIAEKVEAMFHLNTLNSRMKDFYDVWRLSDHFEFDGIELTQAMQLTFSNRGTAVTDVNELLRELQRSKRLEIQWRAFIRKSKIDGPKSFSDVLRLIGPFIAPALESIGNEQRFAKKWTVSTGWQTR